MNWSFKNRSSRCTPYVWRLIVNWPLDTLHKKVTLNKNRFSSCLPFCIITLFINAKSKNKRYKPLVLKKKVFPLMRVLFSVNFQNKGILWPLDSKIYNTRRSRSKGATQKRLGVFTLISDESIALVVDGSAIINKKTLNVTSEGEWFTTDFQ